MRLEVHKGECNQESPVILDYIHTEEIFYTLELSPTQNVYLGLSKTREEESPDFFGAKYTLSVRPLHGATAKPGALIIVVQDITQDQDVLADNFYTVARRIRDIFLRNYGYSERIRYLGNLDEGEEAHLTPTRNHLEEAITVWAAEKVAADRPLTLYLVGHGMKDKFLLNASETEYVTPEDLDEWLSQLEEEVSNLEVNIIIDSCNSGSFIEHDGGEICEGRRVVITSAGPNQEAWSTEKGILFSDHCLSELDEHGSLYTCFASAVKAIQSAIPYKNQTPWLDGDGDNKENEEADFVEAGQRDYFAGEGPPPPFPLSARYRPYIEAVEAPAVVLSEVGTRHISATVRDDGTVERAWVVIYPPSYRPPQGEGFVLGDLVTKTLTLKTQGANTWIAQTEIDFSDFNEQGRYRLVVYAEDGERGESYARTLEVWVGKLYLPIVTR
jgi:hypothetical protein